MRCYFIHGGIVEGVEEFGNIKAADAIRLAKELLLEPLIWQGGLAPDEFEIWDCDRLVHRHPPGDAAGSAGSTAA